ncbi:MAG: PEGA domain-containing protein [Desulfobacteraceae bacterium]|nr:PEGA domain-containing protein [Desulfobacteraceae bacterium]
MKSKVSKVIMILAGMSLFLYMGCDNKGKESGEKARERAEAELEKVKERDIQAKKVIQKKFNAGAKFDSRFESKTSSDKDAGSEEQSGSKEGTLIGSIAVWGSMPGTRGSAEGITVSLRGKDGDYYSEMVDSENRYTITAPPGKYTLTIDEPGYKYFEKSVTVESGRTRLVAPIGLQNA